MGNLYLVQKIYTSRMHFYLHNHWIFYQVHLASTKPDTHLLSEMPEFFVALGAGNIPCKSTIPTHPKYGGDLVTGG